MKKFLLTFLLALGLGLTAVADPVNVKQVYVDSTSTNLAGAGVWTSTVLPAQGYSRLTAMVKASHDSAASGVVIQQSGDEDCATATSPNWDYESTYSYTATDGAGYSVELIGKCVRFKYTNGATLTTTLRIYVQLRSI